MTPVFPVVESATTFDRFNGILSTLNFAAAVGDESQQWVHSTMKQFCQQIHSGSEKQPYFVEFSANGLSMAIRQRSNSPEIPTRKLFDQLIAELGLSLPTTETIITPPPTVSSPVPVILPPPKRDGPKPFTPRSQRFR